MGTPRPIPYNAFRGGVEVIGQAARPGRGRSAHAVAGGEYLTGRSPRLRLVRARQGGREDTGQAKRPGCGRSAHAGAGCRALDKQHAQAVASPRTPGGGRSYLTVGTPHPMPYNARRGGVEVIGQAALPSRGRHAHAGAGGGFVTARSPRSWLGRARRCGTEDTR